MSMQVFAKMLQLITAIAQNSPAVGKRDAIVAIGGFTDRMADTKLKGPACEALTALSEAVGPQFVATQLHNKAAAQKSPKARPTSRTAPRTRFSIRHPDLALHCTTHLLPCCASQAHIYKNALCPPCAPCPPQHAGTIGVELIIMMSFSTSVVGVQTQKAW